MNQFRLGNDLPYVQTDLYLSGGSLPGIETVSWSQSILSFKAHQIAGVDGILYHIAVDHHSDGGFGGQPNEWRTFHQVLVVSEAGFNRLAAYHLWGFLDAINLVNRLSGTERQVWAQAIDLKVDGELTGAGSAFLAAEAEFRAAAEKRLADYNERFNVKS